VDVGESDCHPKDEQGKGGEAVTIVFFSLQEQGCPVTGFWGQPRKVMADGEA